MSGIERIRCDAAELPPAVGEGLRTIVVAPWGRTSTMYGDFLIDDESVREVVKSFAEHGSAVPIDREHETLPENTPVGGSRGAVGWIEKLWGETGRGLLGLAKWTDTGRQLIRSEAFRYLSPVLLIRRDDRRAVALHSVAITTKPAIPRMEKLAASANVLTPFVQGNRAMEVIAKLQTALGLGDDATMETLLILISFQDDTKCDMLEACHDHAYPIRSLRLAPARPWPRRGRFRNCVRLSPSGCRRRWGSPWSRRRPYWGSVARRWPACRSGFERARRSVPVRIHRKQLGVGGGVP